MFFMGFWYVVCPCLVCFGRCGLVFDMFFDMYFGIFGSLFWLVLVCCWSVFGMFWLVSGKFLKCV